jgi:hypothetical protein
VIFEAAEVVAPEEARAMDGAVEWSVGEAEVHMC